MKKFVFLFALAAAALAFTASPAYAQSPTGITVSGEGIVTIEPDVARVTLGAETQDADPLEAQTRNSAKMTDIIAALRALGIDETDIQTTRFSMHPVQNWRDGHGEIIGFMVSSSVNVTVRDINAVGYVLSAATAAGANMSSNISFGLLDGTAPYNRALTLAVEDARNKAQALAGSLNVNVGAAVNVTELTAARFTPQEEWVQYDMVAAAPAAAGARSVPIQGGELTISARVEITFAIAP